MAPVSMTLSDLAKYSMTRSIRRTVSATVELLVVPNGGSSLYTRVVGFGTPGKVQADSLIYGNRSCRCS